MRKPIPPGERRCSLLILDFKTNPAFLEFFYQLTRKMKCGYKKIVIEAVKHYAESLDLHDGRG